MIHTIRKGVVQDKARLVELVRLMIGGAHPDEAAQTLVEALFPRKDYTTFVVESDESGVCGFGVLKFPAFEGADEVAEIVFLGVAEQYRRLRLGSTLAQHIEQYAREQKFRKLYVNVNAENLPAVCFWVKQRYEFEAQMLKFGSAKADDYYLAKELALSDA